MPFGMLVTGTSVFSSSDKFLPPASNEGWPEAEGSDEWKERAGALAQNLFAWLDQDPQFAPSLGEKFHKAAGEYGPSTNAALAVLRDVETRAVTELARRQNGGPGQVKPGSQIATQWINRVTGENIAVASLVQMVVQAGAMFHEGEDEDTTGPTHHSETIETKPEEVTERAFNDWFVWATAQYPSTVIWGEENWIASPKACEDFWLSHSRRTIMDADGRSKVVDADPQSLQFKSAEDYRTKLLARFKTSGYDLSSPFAARKAIRVMHGIPAAIRKIAYEDERPLSIESPDLEWYLSDGQWGLQPWGFADDVASQMVFGAHESDYRARVAMLRSIGIDPDDPGTGIKNVIGGFTGTNAQGQQQEGQGGGQIWDQFIDAGWSGTSKGEAKIKIEMRKRRNAWLEARKIPTPGGWSLLNLPPLAWLAIGVGALGLLWYASKE